MLKTIKADKEDVVDALAEKADAQVVNRKVSSCVPGQNLTAQTTRQQVYSFKQFEFVGFSLGVLHAIRLGMRGFDQVHRPDH